MTLATNAYLSIALLIIGFSARAGAQTLETIPNWEATGVTVDVYTPAGWSASDPTVVFSHGDGLSPSPYHCYREIWAEHGIRTISPYQTNGTAIAGRQARWTETLNVYVALSRLQDPRRIFFAGHSFGAYVTSLAAGADSTVAGGQAGNCVGDDCPALPAQGYVILSGQPAQNAANAEPYWFGLSAFDDLAPRRYVAYGSADASPLDACMASGVPACRGDSYTIDGAQAAELGLQLHVQDGFTHLMFACGPNWRLTHSQPAAMEAFVDDIAAWIAAVSGDSTTSTETTRLTLKDDNVAPVDPRRRSVTFTVRSKRSAPGNRVVVPASGSTGDPTVHGGTLIVASSAGSKERVRVDLPAAGWRSIGTPLEPKGYQYRDSSAAAPIATVVLKADAITVKGKGAGWTYTLDEAQQGRVAVRLGLGDVGWCSDAAARIDVVDRFEGQKSAPPPPVCPIHAAP